MYSNGNKICLAFNPFIDNPVTATGLNNTLLLIYSKPVAANGSLSVAIYRHEHVGDIFDLSNLATNVFIGIYFCLT